MFRGLSRALILTVFLVGTAQAATCPSNPYTLTNGTSADATQVMANFNSILNCANTTLAPIANPSFSGSLAINVTSGGLLKISGGSPVLGFFTPGGGADQKWWDIVEPSSGAALYFRALNDAYTAATNWMIVSRGAGYGVSGVTFVSAVNAPAFNTTSDLRLKTNVTDITYGLPAVMKLRPVGFDWKDQQQDWQKPHQLGLIAQDVEMVVPEAVTTAPDDMHTRGIAYNELMPVLIKAVQDLKAENDGLAARLKTLEAQASAPAAK